MAAGRKKRYVVSVLVGDRVGILRDITTAVNGLGANIDGISQTVVHGFFTVILTATFNGSETAECIKEAILDRFARDEAAVSVIPYDGKDHSRPTVAGDRYIVTLIGKDRPGILKAVTTFLAAKGANVEDWFVEFKGPGVVHVGEITVPHSLDIKQVKEEFGSVLSRFGLSVSLQHKNIFRVTNDIGPIKPLLGEK